ncbi:MAG: response regulator transcription factor [Verrucomicrobiota bacterium]
MKILIAEDNLTHQLMLKSVFSELGYDPVVTGNGLEACEIMLKPDAPKMAIIDWMMPGMEGAEVCRKIKAAKSYEPLYLIILTSRDKPEDLVKGLQAGANDYMVKPYNAEELKARVGVGRRFVELQTMLTDRIKELEKAQTHIKTLQGILPICTYCKKIRDDKQYWQQVEAYVTEHSQAQFSHSICPECHEKFVRPALDMQKKDSDKSYANMR